MPKRKIPRLRRSKSTGQAFIETHGRRIYLGVHGKPETEQRYNQVIAEWLANGRKPPHAKAELTVNELCAAYSEHARSYYRRPNGSVSDMMSQVRSSIGVLMLCFGHAPVSDFGPVALRSCRQYWIEKGLSRGVCNKYTSQIVRIFKWGVSQEMLPVTVYQALTTVEGLRKGRCDAREPQRVTSVPMASVEPVRALLPPALQALVDLQLINPFRPSEVLTLRPRDIDTSGPVWFAWPHHKNEHRGLDRVIAFGPRAQAILRPFMLRHPDAHMFDPREDYAHRRAAGAEGARRERQKSNPRQTERVMGPHYTIHSYRRAIKRTCDQVNAERAKKGHPLIEVWSPYRLKKNSSTAIRTRFGLEAAQVACGHEHAKTTEIYAERDLALLVKVMAEAG